MAGISYEPPTGGASPAEIEAAVDSYLTANPPGVPDHNDTTLRDATDAHPMSSVTGLPAALDARIVVVSAGTNLSTARPSGAAAVLWKFNAGVDVGTNGANIVNAQFGDLWAVAS